MRDRFLIPVPENRTVRSLCWRGDELVDWAAGGHVYRLDGSFSPRHVNYAYRFDAAVCSPCGRFAAIYEKLGTKALLLDDGEVVREVNRSFYHAHVYEYPIVLWTLSDGRAVIAHCPENYHRIEIEEFESGRRLSSRDDEGTDHFFSRLQVSPDAKHLLTAGWTWHPFDSVAVFDLEEALHNPIELDKRANFLNNASEANSATWLDGNRVALASSREADDFSDDEPLEGRLSPGRIGVWNLERGTLESVAPLEEEAGTMLAASPTQVVGFFEHPKLIDVTTGRVLRCWPDIQSGRQNSSIIWHQKEPFPILALDAAKRRFAIVQDKQIVVIAM